MTPGSCWSTVPAHPSDAGIDIAAMASLEDACVAAGYLSVRVRPWGVRLAGA